MSSVINIYHIIPLIGLFAVFAAVTNYLKFGVTTKKLIAVTRAVIQLLILGIAIKYIFQIESNSAHLLILLIMTISAVISSAFISNKANKMQMILFISLLLSVWPMCFIGIFALDSKLLFDITFLLPIFGMIMGNSLNGVSLGIERVQTEAKINQELINFYIGFGADPYNAFKDIIRNAYKASITSILNTMNIVGLVSIPGMMTGQVLAGRDPYTSALYQIFILIVISCSVFLGSLVGIHLTYKKIKDDIIKY